MCNLVSYRGIVNERLEDAPFVGALIIAKSCSIGCKNCFNQHLKDAKEYRRSAEAIIADVMRDKFNKGIILGGLEWSEQPKELKLLVEEAKLNNLEVMIYTGRTEKDFLKIMNACNLQGCYIKFGGYEENFKANHYISYGIKLSSLNQYIVLVP